MSINKVTLLGRVGKEIELKNLSNDKCVADVSVATTEKYKKGNETHENTEWHNCVAWGQNAKFASQYISKGDLVYVEGKLKTEQYEKDGITRYTTKIWIETIQLCAKKDQTSKPTSQQQPSSNAPKTGQKQAAQKDPEKLPWES